MLWARDAWWELKTTPPGAQQQPAMAWAPTVMLQRMPLPAHSPKRRSSAGPPATAADDRRRLRLPPPTTPRRSLSLSSPSSQLSSSSGGGSSRSAKLRRLTERADLRCGMSPSAIAASSSCASSSSSIVGHGMVAAVGACCSMYERRAQSAECRVQKPFTPGRSKSKGLPGDTVAAAADRHCRLLCLGGKPVPPHTTQHPIPPLHPPPLLFQARAGAAAACVACWPARCHQHHQHHRHQQLQRLLKLQQCQWTCRACSQTATKAGTQVAKRRGSNC